MSVLIFSLTKHDILAHISFSFGRELASSVQQLYNCSVYVTNVIFIQPVSFFGLIVVALLLTANL